MQSALTDAKSALNAKESQEKVDKATDALNAAIKALVKNGNQAGSQNGSATPTVTKKAGTTTDGSASKGTSGSKAAKPGDPENVPHSEQELADLHGREKENKDKKIEKIFNNFAKKIKIVH